MSVFRERHDRYETITALLRLAWNLLAAVIYLTLRPAGARLEIDLVLALTLIYTFLMLAERVRKLVAGYRLRWLPPFLDGVLITLLVLRTGGAESPLAIFYLLAVVAYNLRLRLRGGILVGLGALAFYGLVVFQGGAPGGPEILRYLLLAFVILLAALGIGVYSNDNVKIRLKLEEANRNLKQLVNTDELTGLYNYRYFQERLQEEMERADRKRGEVSLMMVDIDDFKVYNDLFGHVQGDLVLKEFSKVLRENARMMDMVARYGGEEFVVIMPETQTQPVFALGERLRKVIEKYPFYGVDRLPGGRLTISIGLASYPTQTNRRSALIELADQALYRAKQQKNRVETCFSILDDLKIHLQPIQDEALEAVKSLMAVVEAKDPYTYQHSERVVDYATKIAERLGWSHREIRYLRYSAFLHDVGKIEISKGILNKKGELTEEERQVIARHPSMGVELVRPIRKLWRTIPFILYHQEKYDGTGYPYGLKEDEIPYGARVLAVADSFDAMTSERPYRPAKSLQEAREELIRCAGTCFDPLVAEMMVEIVDEILEKSVKAEVGA